MYKSMMDAYVRYCGMSMNSMEVLNHRLPILNAMASNPAALYDPSNWLEVNRMVSEKIMAFSQANFELAVGMSQIPYGTVPSLEKVLQIQKRASKPVSRTLASNAKRARKTAKHR